MPTFEVMAKELGVSKQTIRNWAQRLDPEGEHVDRSAEAHVIDAELASMIAHMVTRKKRGKVDGSDGNSEAIASVVNVSNDRLGDVIRQYEEIVRLKDEHRDMLIASKDDRIRDLTERVEELTRRLDEEMAAHDKTRRELALARALEGFKWPWQRREIMTRYALPGPRETQ